MVTYENFKGFVGRFKIQCHLDLRNSINLTKEAILHIFECLDKVYSLVVTLNNKYKTILTDDEKKIVTDKTWSLAFDNTNLSY